CARVGGGALCASGSAREGSLPSIQTVVGAPSSSLNVNAYVLYVRAKPQVNVLAFGGTFPEAFSTMNAGRLTSAGTSSAPIETVAGDATLSKRKSIAPTTRGSSGASFARNAPASSAPLRGMPA